MQRRASWLKGALRDVAPFPDEVKRAAVGALRLAANGEKALTAKPLSGLGPGVLEIVLRHRGDAFRKKSTSGIETPRPEIELIQERIRRLEEQLR